MPLPAVEVSTEQCTPLAVGFEGLAEQDFALTPSLLTFFTLLYAIRALCTSGKLLFSGLLRWCGNK